ncbi:response regulator [Pseudalkalibacillus sp. A8]|uniref:response regulator transcription factor n=1 Tax=Pseudalkalibacillus sp. A8 TaxID=3382641 RepID=UPI0038B69CE0
MKPIKVLIADDELIVRKGLISAVDWEKHNMIVVADVPNGEKGWSEYLRYSPDIIITDIVMPVINGITFAKKVKSHKPTTKILLLSCHRDFEYAQEGIRLGASGYILKTAFDEQELEDYLKGFREEILKERLSGLKLSHNASSFTKCFFQWLCGFNSQFEKELQKRFDAEWSWMNEPFFAFFIQSNSNLSVLLQDKVKANESKTTYEMISCGEGQYFLFVSGIKESIIDKLLVDIKSKDESFKWMKSDVIFGKEKWVETVKGMKHFADFERKHQISTEDWPKTIILAVQLILSQLDKPFLVSEVAEKVGVSRSHFSTLFKKVVGESFQAFIDRKKFELATQILVETTLPIQEVSEHIGIMDSKYFSKWFKKLSGLSPSQFRAKHLSTSNQTDFHLNDLSNDLPLKTE